MSQETSQQSNNFPTFIEGHYFLKQISQNLKHWIVGAKAFGL